MNAVIKQRLREMLPDARVFLDVDDLKEGKGAEYVDASSVTLVFCSSGYFDSANCMRELLRAVVTGKPIVALLELEANKGGLSREEIRARLLAADARCEKRGTVFQSKHAMWGLKEEVHSWGYVLPAAEELFDALFVAEPIEWNRCAIPGCSHASIRLPSRSLLLPAFTHAASGPSRT